MRKSLITKILNLKKNHQIYVQKHGMSILDMKLSIVLTRMIYELMNDYSDFNSCTLKAIRQIVIFGHSWYLRNDSEFNNELKNFLYDDELKFFSKKLQSNKIGVIGAANWMRFYEILDEEIEDTEST